MLRRWFFLIFLLVAVPLQAQTLLVSPGSVWKYLDNGSDQGAAWRAPNFDDSAWKSGPAKLGYGDADVVTRVAYGPNSSSKYVTTYFRHSFQVADAGAFTSLPLRVRRDDGIVLYLNGVEVWRSNMPAGSPLYTTLASSSASDDGATWQTPRLSTTALVTGNNVLAAEVHQSAGSSTDLSFDLELQGATGAFVNRGPYLQLGTSSGVQVRWRTDAASDSVVRYGLLPTSLTAVIGNATVTTEHVVDLTGLLPNTRYYYSVGSSAAAPPAADENQYFVTAPEPGSSRPARIWVIGDAGTGTSVQARVRNAYETFTGTRHTDLWLQLGDNAYNTGTDAEYQLRMFDVYRNLLSKSVTWSTLGNHETAQSTNPPSTLPYYNLFSFPTAGQAGGVASGSKNYYSFDFGDIHFICLDSMVSSRAPGSPMLTWLQADLAANTKAWTVAFWHHPPYTKGTHDSDTEGPLIGMRTNVLPILESYGVDLVLSGHSHVYERSYLIDGHYGLSSTFTSAMKKDGGSGRPAETGAYRKPLGSMPHAGAVYSVVGSSGKTGSGTLNHPAMFVSLSAAGSMVLDIEGNQLSAKFLSDTGAVRDSFSIVKGSSVNQAPTVAMSAPAPGSSFAAPASIGLTASAADADGSIARVDFYNGATLLGSSSTAPYSYNWAAVPAGSYNLSARAVDNLGAITISPTVGVSVAPAVPSTLVAKTSLWKYHTSATGPGADWASPSHDDAAWPSGRALLGYGDTDIVTTLPYGGNSQQKYIAAYFRQAFQVVDRSRYASLKLNLLRDDGAVVYLNGTELTRSNMPAGSIGPSTKASSTVGSTAENTYFSYAVPSSLLRDGTNVIAVEVHQSVATSSDLRFGLELVGQP